jgi:hypothetical protein
MDESLSHWLRLRESADAAARSDALTRVVADALDVDGPVHVVDLATGTGSNIRYLVDRLPRPKRWLAIDRDAQLLDELPERMSRWGESRGYTVQRTAAGCAIRGDRLDCQIETHEMNLGALNDDRIFADRQLVTASALLDLVSAPWLRALAAQCRSAAASALFTITYNGRSSCAPTEPEDEIIRDLMNRHQKRDKGLGGPAEGPEAAGRAEEIFSAAGFRVRREASDWTLGARDAHLQRELVDGWARAATEIAPDLKETIACWRERRLRHVRSGRSRIVVGHDDIAALVPR